MRASPWTIAGWVLLLGAILAFGVITSPRAGDFFVYYSAGKQLLQHDFDLYGREGLAYRYAPAIAFAFIPFSFLPMPAAAFLWFLLKVAALGVIIRTAIQSLNLGADSFWKVLGISFLAAGGYVVEEWRTGNIHFLVLFLMVLAFFHLESGKNLSSALFVAAAGCAKITPFFLLLYFALLKRWKTCLLGLGWTALLVLGPSLYLGWEKNIDLTRDWLHSAIARGSEPVNHSLRGVLFKYLHEGEATPETEKYPRVNLFNLRSETIVATWVLLCLLLVVFLIKAILSDYGGPPGRLLKYALMITSLLLLSPHDSRIYFSTLVFPCAVLTALIWRCPERKPRVLSTAALGISCLLSALLPALMPGRRASLTYETLSPYFFGALLVWIALYSLISRLENADPLPD